MKKPTKPAGRLLKEREAVRQAIGVYSGPVTQCPPGNARAKIKRIAADRAAQWLTKHWNDRPIENRKAERKRFRIARNQRECIAARNAPLLKRIDSEERKIRQNLALIKTMRD